MPMPERMKDACRTFVNALWRAGGCEYVDETMLRAGVMCPVCGAKGVGVEKPMVRHVEPDTSQCLACGHEWERHN